MHSLVIVETQDGTKKMRLVSTEIVCERVAEYITKNQEILLGVFTTREVMDILLEVLAKEGRG